MGGVSFYVKKQLQLVVDNILWASIINVGEVKYFRFEVEEMKQKFVPPIPRPEWPDLLTAPDLSDMMNGWLGVNRAYELFQANLFPIQRIGPAKVVTAADFFSWLDGSDLWARCMKAVDALWDETEEYITVKIPVDSIKKLPDEVKKLLKK